MYFPKVKRVIFVYLSCVCGGGGGFASIRLRVLYVYVPQLILYYRSHFTEEETET